MGLQMDFFGLPGPFLSFSDILVIFGYLAAQAILAMKMISSEFGFNCQNKA